MNTPLPPILETKLAEFRRRVWIVKLAEGVLAALCGVILSYLIVFVLDRFGETPKGLRIGLLCTLALGLGIGLPWKWHRWVWRQRGLEQAARLLRRTFPMLGDQLLGLVELARADSQIAGRSERLVQAAMAQAAEAVKDRDFSQAVPQARHREWGWATAGGVALVLTAFLTVSDAARNALARWIMPWRNTERFTFAQVEPLPTHLVVPYAEPFQLPVKLATTTRRSPLQGQGQIGAQLPVVANLSEGVYDLGFPPQKEDATLAVALGDVRKEVRVEPRLRPELAELAVRLRLPAYLEYKSEPRIEARGGTVSLLKGSEAAFEAKASRVLAAGDLDGAAQQIEGEKLVTAWQPVTGTAERTFTWRDVDGLTPRVPLILKVLAVEDEAPKIVARRDAPEQVVLESEVLAFEVTASDDFGLKRVGLEWAGSLPQADGKTPVHGEKLAAGGQPEGRELAVKATFSAQREHVAPQTLEVRAWAEDYLPGRKRSYSSAFTLHVLNKTDHALWVTEQMAKWLTAAKESYEREQQLHQMNKELRALSAAELERPENRRRVAQQATAENGNAARLESLTQNGRSLVEQATRNDEFDAARLESWATMVKSLKEIAATRMPSVSDLLKKTASAPAGQPSVAPAKNSKWGNSGAQVAQNGAKAGGEAKTDGANPGEGKPAETRPLEGGTPAASDAPRLTDGESSPPTQPGTPTDPKAPPKPGAPSLSDQEKGTLAAGETKPSDSKPTPKKPSAGKLSLPQTTMAAAPSTGKDEPAPPPAETPAQEKLEGAIAEQKDLLAEFAKVSDELNQILGSLEASTFVKRLKAASRQQMGIASNINQKTLDAFGIERASAPALPPIAENVKAQGEVIRVLQSDLDAYFERKQDSRYKNILDDMKKTSIVRAMEKGSEKVAANFTGQTMAGSEFWADTLDRWSEELVAASHCKSSSNCSGDSLPPEIVLKVMQALRDEMKLRDETREAESAKPALTEEKHLTDAKALGDTQAGIGGLTQSTVRAIAQLPQGTEKFGKELKLLTQVVSIMDESEDLLTEGETGPKTVAAETEAIELLLQAKRSSPKGGGGGGSNPGGGGTAETASSAALADLGPGSDAKSVVTARPVGQATGRAGQEFPEEFKSGLESYFNLLEAPSAGR